MRKVSAREFQVHGSKYLKKLPIVLTRHNIPIATIIPYKDITQETVNIGPFKPSGNIELKAEEDNVKYLVHQAEENNTNDIVISKYPNNYMGKPLSGKTARCHVCNEENIPVEFAQKHYNERHEDI